MVKSNRNSKSTEYRLFFIIAGLIVVLTLAVYWQVHSFEFVTFDDDDYVTANPNLRLGFTAEGIKWAFSSMYYIANWHPLTWLSLMLDYKLYGMNGGGFHVTNLIFHLASTVLLFWVFVRMTKALWPSAFVAAVFALHPLHVESVVWIAERKDVLSTFFWFLTMLAYIRYTENETKMRYLAVVVFFVLGLMAKPMLVTLPLALLLVDYWPLGRISKRAVIEKIPLVIITILFCIITFAAQKGGDAVSSLEGVSIARRLAIAIVAYAGYIGKTIWPVNLAVLYPVLLANIQARQVAVAAGALVCITVIFAILGKKYKWLLTGWLWYLGTLVPVIGLVKVGSQAMADRYMYVPMIGLSIIVGWSAWNFGSRVRRRNLFLGGLAVIVLFALAVSAKAQIGYWRNSETLYRRAISVTKYNFVMNKNLAIVLLERGDFKGAEPYFREALSISPEKSDLCVGLGMSLVRQDKLDEAIEFFGRAIKLDSKNVDAHYNLGFALYRKGDYAAAIENLNEASRLDPNHAMAHNILGLIFSQQNEADKALYHYEQSIRIKPDDAETHYMLAALLEKAGRFDKAEAEYLEAIRIEPNSQKANYALGRLYFKGKRYEQAVIYLEKTSNLSPAQAGVRSAVENLKKAIASYRQAVTLHKEGKIEQCIPYYRQAMVLNPDWLEVVNNLAWLFATNTKVRNPVEAVGLAERACSLTGYNQPEILDTLAVAYAANGDFGKAVETAKKAVDLAGAANDLILAKKIGERLELYKKGEAYVEPAE